MTEILLKGCKTLTHPSIHPDQPQAELAIGLSHMIQAELEPTAMTSDSES